MAPPAPRECNQPARIVLHRKPSTHCASQRNALHRNQLAARSAHRIPCIALHCIASCAVHRTANATNPVPACSGQPLPGKRSFSSPLRNSYFSQCTFLQMTYTIVNPHTCSNWHCPEDTHYSIRPPQYPPTHRQTTPTDVITDMTLSTSQLCCLQPLQLQTLLEEPWKNSGTDSRVLQEESVAGPGEACQCIGLWLWTLELGISR
jgi:hypothetical protein